MIWRGPDHLGPLQESWSPVTSWLVATPLPIGRIRSAIFPKSWLRSLSVSQFLENGITIFNTSSDIKYLIPSQAPDQIKSPYYNRTDTGLIICIP